MKKIIDIVSPSFPDLSATLEQAEGFIKSMGFIPRIQPNMIEKDAHLFAANTDKTRYEQLLKALDAKDSDIIWAFRGGYGATRLLPMLEKHDFSRNPKTIVGFSDITALSNYFYNKYGWKTIHTGVLVEYSSPTHRARKISLEKEVSLIKQFLSGEEGVVIYPLHKLIKSNSRDVIPQRIQGKLVGGNLSLLQCSIGTNWQIDATDKILFIEDVGEQGYSIHRMLTHLEQAGIFDNIKALIIGSTECAPEKDGSVMCEDAIIDFIKNKKFPVFINKDFGHGVVNYPLMLGSDITILGTADLADKSLSYATLVFEL